MRHSFMAEGFGVRLRPVCLEDAAFIVWLRNLDHAKGKLGDSATDVAHQEAWLNAYFDREGDCYFIVETLGGIAVGTHGLYEPSNGSAEAGRLIVRPEVPAAVPTSLITFDLAFGEMGLAELRGTSISTNVKVHSYVAKFGFRTVRVESAAKVVAGQPVDIVHFAMTAAEWQNRRPSVLPIARYAEAQVRAWDTKHAGVPPASN
jgi:RimJ/RimL family protein N-acetyltransferase